MDLACIGCITAPSGQKITQKDSPLQSTDMYFTRTSEGWGHGNKLAMID